MIHRRKHLLSLHGARLWKNGANDSFFWNRAGIKYWKIATCRWHRVKGYSREGGRCYSAQLISCACGFFATYRVYVRWLRLSLRSLQYNNRATLLGSVVVKRFFSFLFSLSLVSNSTLHTPYKFTPRTRLTRRSCNVLYIPCYYITVRDDYPVLVLLFCPTLDALCFVIRASSDTSSRSNPCSPPFFAPLFIQNLKLFRSLLSPWVSPIMGGNPRWWLVRRWAFAPKDNSES